MNQLTEMNYDMERDRWVVQIDGRPYGLHCGEDLKIFIADRLHSCRIELDEFWYVNLTNTSFTLRPRQTYLVAV